MKRILLGLLFLPLAGCASLPFLGKKEVKVGGVYRENFDQDRIVDLVIVRKLTGKKSFFVMNESAPYLEGYIRGAVVDYEDNPLQGIVVRASDRGKDIPGFDPAVSDANGIYKIRFSLPVKKNRVEIRGVIAYNPPWQQQLDILGATIEPQTKETNFRLLYDRKRGFIGIGEDVPKMIGKKVSGAAAARVETKDKKATVAPAAPPAAPPKQKRQDDFFGGFGDFGN